MATYEDVQTVSVKRYCWLSSRYTNRLYFIVSRPINSINPVWSYIGTQKEYEATLKEAYSTPAFYNLKETYRRIHA
ncbi:MAG: hypothetical protein ACLUVY_05730 [Bacteroides uniformis]